MTPRSMPRGCCLPWVVCGAALLAADAAHAKIFLRWGAAARSDRALASLGGALVYEAPIELNGGPGEMSVFSFRKALPDLIGDLRRTFPAGAFHGGSGNLAVGDVAADGRVLRFVLLCTAPGSRVIVFKYEQSADADRRAREGPPRDGIPGIPAFPDARATFHARDARTRTVLAVAETRAGPAAVADFYAEALPAAGWTAQAAAAPRDPGRPAMQIYQRDAELCCVYAGASADGRTTRITLLHKRLGVH